MVPINSGEILNPSLKRLGLNHPVWNRACFALSLELFFHHNNDGYYTTKFNLRTNNVQTRKTATPYAKTYDEFTNSLPVGDVLTLKEPMIFDRITKVANKKQLQTLFGLFSKVANK